MLRCTVCLATPKLSAMAGIEGSRSPAAQSPRRMRSRSWSAICRWGTSAAPGLMFIVS